jgi:hypothetical protein
MDEKVQRVGVVIVELNGMSLAFGGFRHLSYTSEILSNTTTKHIT